MIWPRLVPPALCRTPVKVTLYREGVDEDGAPQKAAELEVCCNWQDSARVIRTGETHTAQLTGVAIFPGDLCPDLAEITSGRVEVFGGVRSISRGTKARNPDGTVNYTRLEVE